MTPLSRRSTVPAPEYSDRGFAGWVPIAAQHGHVVEVYESSSAEGPHLWVSVRGECHLDGPAKPCAGIPAGVAPGYNAAHLSMDAARLLRDQLDAAIKHSEDRFA